MTPEWMFVADETALEVLRLVNGARDVGVIEGFWSYAKNWLYPYRGVPRKHFHLYLGEICYRFNHRNEDLKPLLIKLLQTISSNHINPSQSRQARHYPM